jgi:hypothetical protein
MWSTVSDTARRDGDYGCAIPDPLKLEKIEDKLKRYDQGNALHGRGDGRLRTPGVRRIRRASCHPAHPHALFRTDGPPSGCNPKAWARRREESPGIDPVSLFSGSSRIEAGPVERYTNLLQLP